MFNAENDIKKWAPVLEHADAPAIKDNYRKAVTAKLLENTEIALKQESAQFGSLTENNQTTSAVGNFDPVLISLVRRAMPNLIAYDVAGVQPMSGPTGLIFAMKSRYNDLVSSPKNAKIDAATDPEALGLAEPSTAFSAGGDPTTAGGTTGGLSKSAGEAAGTSGGDAFGDMGFTIEKASVEAKTRALKAEYSMELAQDLKAIHNLDAESELANILSTEILAEINREVINTIKFVAKPGFQNDAVSPINNVFDLATDADGRWAVEKFKSLMFQLEIEANKIAVQTRRGKGNFVICSSNVASALAAAGSLDYTPALSANLEVDDTGNTFAGVLNGRMKVYIDPYAGTQDFAVVGYRGPNPYDAGLFYCPYVPLTMVRAVDEATFQPKIAFKTRYGMTKNPFVDTVEGASASNAGVGSENTNPYFRNFNINNINVAG
tara:strand:- start:604 stop:1908 length:1305 start_codon:yes stop_codon:yes gene_type:complete